ncbi:hypothetical protein O3P69_018830 [Scylla paramamosain]|uniref:Amino acid transporter transmembrane domain-containing protein n=1 Tax=Scylla paramamosain TaxID=85552 RepID=A0AAW0ST82_SCYPA
MTEIAYPLPAHSEAMEGAPERKKALSMGMTAFFLIAQMAGAGFLALPRALANTGWLGAFMLPLFCFSVGFVGTRLGRSWVILEERWPKEYKGRVRQPYKLIAERSMGPIGGRVTQIVVLVKLFGSSTVHMILISEMVAAVVQEQTDFCLTKCHVILIVGAVLIPLTWLGSPKDLWQASILAVVATVVAIVVIVVQIFISFGSILFAFGGMATFPTIQNDMADRSQFWQSVAIGFSGIITLYMPVALAGYIKIGDAVSSNIILSVEMTDAVLVAIGMQIINLLCTFLLSSNPVYQSLEEVFNVRKGFSPQRCVVRASVVSMQMLIGLAVPNFGKLLNLIGGSLITLCTFVLPPVMYIKLVKDKSDKTWPERSIPLWEKVFLVEAIIVGVVGGVLSTITALYDVIEVSFTSNCFNSFSEC